MQDLCESLYREINGLSAGASKAYSDLETSMDRLFSQRRLNFEAIKYNRRSNGKKKSIFIHSGTPEVQKRVGKNAERISRARSGLEEISFDGTLESCAHAMDAMNSVYHALGEALPAPDEADVLVDEILERYDKTRYGENVAFLKRISPITGLLGSAITSMHMDAGAISEAIVSAAASLSAFSSRFVHRPYFGLAFTHLGLGAATLTALLSGHVSSHSFTDVPEANYIINGVALGTLGLINTALGTIAGAAANSERKFRKIAGEIKISKLKYDGLLRVGVALEEGKRNLGYVMRVCESEKRDPRDFEDQLNTLREAMGNYLGGKGSYGDLVSARVSYFPVLIENFERLATKLGKSLFGEGFNFEDPSGSLPVNVPKKLKMSPEEWAKKREELQTAMATLKKKRLRTKVEEENVLDQEVFDEDDFMDFSYRVSPALQEAYDTGRKRVGGISIVQLMDMSRQKIEGAAEARIATNGDLALEHTNRVTLITQKGEWKNLQRRIRNRHNLGDNVRLYALHPHRYLRCIFSTEGDGNKITLLEVLTHDEYDKLKENS